MKLTSLVWTKGSRECCGHRQVWAYVLTPWATATPRARAFVLAPPLSLRNTTLAASRMERRQAWLSNQPALPQMPTTSQQSSTCAWPWQPWSAPSAQLLQAMQQAQRVRGIAPAAVEMIIARARRVEAITELAYEETHVEHLPESYRYQRLARARLRRCPPPTTVLRVSTCLCPQGFSAWRF